MDACCNNWWAATLVSTCLAMGCGPKNEPADRGDDASCGPGADASTCSVDTYQRDGEEEETENDTRSETDTPDAVNASLPYAQSVVDFSPGEGAEFGQDRFPGVVLGPPKGRGKSEGSLDVLSLGAGGEITLAFGDRAIEDGEGADFIVYENPIIPYGGGPEDVYAELGEVSVSRDGETWKTFECDTEPESPGTWPGCAGWNPVLEYDPEKVNPPKPGITGGDPFDLAEVGLEKARYVRIRDLDEEGGGEKAGFDLDAVGISNPVRE